MWKNFGHYCYNCGYDRQLHPHANGYCSEKCLKEDNGPEYDEEDDEEILDDNKPLNKHFYNQKPIRKIIKRRII